jgi:hypothetical protein
VLAHISAAVSINWTYNNSPQTPFNFCISGTNASQATVQAYIQSAGTYWFEPNISIHETKLSQFWDGTSRTVGGGCANTPRSTLDPKTPGDPICGFPGGYGTMQLDPPAGMPALWNWLQNIQDGDALLQTIAGPVQDTSNANGSGPANAPGYPFWIRQVKQWLIYNNVQAASNQTPAPEPATVDPGPPSGYPPSPNCNFTVSLNGPLATNGSTNAGVATVPYAGSQPNTYWYGDAIVMKRYDGAPTDYVSWNNTQQSQGVTPFWSFNKANSVSQDIVYEFCTCSTTQSCLNSIQ